MAEERNAPSSDAVVASTVPSLDKQPTPRAYVVFPSGRFSVLLQIELDQLGRMP